MGASSWAFAPVVGGVVGLLFREGTEDEARSVEEDPRVAELLELCRCGHDRGDHLDDGEHACDVRRVVSDGRRELVDVCVCRGFERARITKDMRARLLAPCACGCAFASHSVSSPHACESCAGCRSFTAAEPVYRKEDGEQG